MADPVKKILLRSGVVRWRTMVDVGKDADGKRKQLTITRDTRAEVVAERARIINQRRTGQLIVPSKMTVDQLLDAYMVSKEDDLEETTIDGYENRLTHIRARLGSMQVQELTDTHVEEFVTWLLTEARRRGGPKGTGLRPSTVDGVLGRLRAALRYALRKKIVAQNVAEFVTVPRKARKQDRRDNQREQPWGVVEVKEFVVGIREDRLFAPLLLSCMGLRPAEVAGLRWAEDIDFEAGSLDIANTRTMIRNARVVEKDTKSEAGERTLPLPEPVKLALMNFRLLQEAEQAKLGEYYLPSGYVFVDELGQALTPRHLREHAYRTMSRLGLRRVRLYDARHSCLTFLAVSGIPDVILAAWAGHTNASFTKKKYVHPTAADMGAAVIHLNELLGVADGPSESAV
ncbi:site-specific integrase [Streptomyces sp. NBC_01549]|uniref:site-specific integrase n=1 Tax=Streptomyces sp. NBC_01549 TaxID=2975874 RepID=UPI0022523997|nr:site-specific integrase [Streptomyces sp. NBC_01549]MCX4592380.1 site-specific integrase [Streptomyces sp. NBC_01549]